MYEKLKLKDKGGRILKKHHHVNLGKSFLKDCETWEVFLKNATAIELCRAFIDIGHFVNTNTLNFYLDTSLHPDLGMGAVYGNSWMAGMWGRDFITSQSPSIEFLELFALVAAVLAWGHSPELTNTQVIIFCNNQATLHMVNGLGSSCGKCRKLTRILTLNNLQFNRRVFVKYVKSS